jgi:hypothetical protein
MSLIVECVKSGKFQMVIAMYVDYRLKVDNETGKVSIKNLMSEEVVVSGVDSRVEGVLELSEYLSRNIPSEPDGVVCNVQTETEHGGGSNA